MKKKLLVTLLAVSVVLSMTACGKTTPVTTEVTEDVVVEETTEETVDDTEEIVDEATEVETEEPATEEVVEATEEVSAKDIVAEERPSIYEDPLAWPMIDNKVESRYYDFGESSATCTVEVSVFADFPEMSYYEVNYKTWQGFPMHYRMVGPSSLMDWAHIRGIILEQYQDGNAPMWEEEVYDCKYHMSTMTTGFDYEDTYLDRDKAFFTSLSNESWRYNDGYYDEQRIPGEVDTNLRITYAVEGAGYKGYALIINDLDQELTYQQWYVEREDVYDDERALGVVTSIQPIIE